MAIVPTLVAKAEDPTISPYIGHPFTEIPLSQPDGASAVYPMISAPLNRDKIVESLTGSDARLVRRKLGTLEIPIDWIDGDRKAQIEKLYHDARTVYLSPNAGPETLYSFPLQGDLTDFMGNRTGLAQATRGASRFVWDDEDRVFRSWSSAQAAFPINGKWERYYASMPVIENEVSDPHPTSTSHGWLTTSGTCSFTYTEDRLSPVLSQRQVTNQKGTVFALAGGSVANTIRIVASAITNSEDIMATVCAAWEGTAKFSICDSSGGTAYAQETVEGDGRFKLVRLVYDNAFNLSSCSIRIDFSDAGATVYQGMHIGPVFIGSSGSSGLADYRGPDWAQHTTAMTQDGLEDTGGPVHYLPAFTLSFFARYQTYAGWVQWDTADPNRFYIWQANNYMAVQHRGSGSVFTSLSTFFPDISDGDWMHVCLTATSDGGGTSGLLLYLNGQAHPTTSHTWEASLIGSNLRIGRIGGGGVYTNSQGGVSHVRLDQRAWSADEVKDHYDTYFKDAGRGINEPLFMKELIIEDLEWECRTGGSGDQWTGVIRLRELGPTDAAGMVRRVVD